MLTRTGMYFLFFCFRCDVTPQLKGCGVPSEVADDTVNGLRLHSGTGLYRLGTQL